jgi:putative ABC transport system permease protein
MLSRRLVGASILAFGAAILPATLVAAGHAPADAPPSILVSRQLLQAERLAVGDLVSLSAEGSGAHPREFRIAGVYEPVPDPMRLGAVRHEIRMHLPDLIAMTADPADAAAAETVDAINVAIANPADAASFARERSARLPGLIVRSTVGDEMRAAPFVVLERFHLAIAIVTVVASSIFLLALMLMVVDERRETVGILRLIGFRRDRVLLYVVAEGFVIAATGSVVGIVLAALLQGGINRFFQWRYDTALVFVRITARIALRSTVMAVPLGVLAAVAASWTLLRQQVFSLRR